MKDDRFRYAPPGMDLALERKHFWLSMLGAILWSMTFLFRFQTELDNLYVYYEQGRILRTNLDMPDFCTMLDGVFLGFSLPLFVIFAAILVRYLYYYKGSRSIWLMRRLPDRWLIWRTCLVQPLRQIPKCLAVMIATFLVYYLMYMFCTPEACLQPDQWQKLWRMLL